MFVHFVTELSTEPVNRHFYDASLKDKNTEITNKTFNTSWVWNEQRHFRIKGPFNKSAHVHVKMYVALCYNARGFRLWSRECRSIVLLVDFWRIHVEISVRAEEKINLENSGMKVNEWNSRFSRWNSTHSWEICSLTRNRYFTTKASKPYKSNSKSISPHACDFARSWLWCSCVDWSHQISRHVTENQAANLILRSRWKCSPNRNRMSHFSERISTL